MRPMAYVVIRERVGSSRVDYLGPVVSTPRDIWRDANRLYRRDEWDRLSWVAASRAPQWMRRKANEQQ